MGKLKLILFFLFLFNINSIYADDSWGYAEDNGPATWGQEFKLCAHGQRQSPLEIKDSNVKLNPQLPALHFEYKNSVIDIKNTGHDILLNYEKGSKIIFSNKEYELSQLDFHSPAEHIIHGKIANIEIHLVHTDKKGHLFVVALMVNKGKMNYALNDIFNNIPQEKNTTYSIKNKKINPLDFLPQKKGYYVYMGSLTTPPCSENVTWIILTEPIEASLEQIMKLTKVYRMNNRPTQQLNVRIIQQKL